MTVLFRGSSGLNTKLDPARIRFNSQSGISDLALAVNVVTDDTGRISRRNGSARVITGSWHSLHSCGLYGLGVTGDALSVIESTYATTAIRRVTPNARVSYETVRDRTFYVNGFQVGYVEDRLSYPWVKPNTYLGIDSTEVWYDPPIGHLVAYHKGRMLVAKDNVIWISRAQDFFRFNGVCVILPDRIKMIRPVQNGFFVGTTDETYFLAGEISTTNLQPFQKIRVASYGVAEGTDLAIPGQRVGEGMGNEIAIWTSYRGVCIGTGDGMFYNLTEKKISLPSAEYGTAVYKDGAYIVLLEP